jgi:hypothetical protein
MAGLALKWLMRILQAEIGVRMVESLLIEACDFRVAPFVVGVTALALFTLYRRRDAVKATFVIDVFGDGFVAIETKLALFSLLECGMTFFALLLQFGVTFDNFSRHDERIETLRAPNRRESAKTDEREHRDHFPQPLAA